jgi:MurNAc alpha-1-phosphate uridylyltransferase
MVPNPAFHPRGDFWLDGDRLNEDGAGERLTFANIGVYRGALVADEAATRFKLLPHFQRAMREGKLSGERFDGYWTNIGTPAQLQEASLVVPAKAGT